jgi:predicted ester cyclase
MPEEENKAAARRIAGEVFNEHSVDALDELLDPDVFNHEAIADLQHGIDGFNEAVRWVLAAFPDLRYDTEDIVAEGDQVMARLTFSGTHEGEFWGISPTGRRITVQHVH